MVILITHLPNSRRERIIPFGLSQLLLNCRRIRDELANQNAETTNLTNKLDRVSMAGTIR